MDIQKFVQDTLQSASAVALTYFGKVSGTTKPEDNNQVLTDADLAVGKHIIEQINTQFPQHNIIDEETGITFRSSRYTWVIDPIDGTSNFAAGVPLYGIMMGLLEDDIPVAGGIALPSFSEVYYGEKFKNAWCNGHQITVTKNDNLLNSLVAYGIDGHQDNPEQTKQECAFLSELVLKIRNLRTSNSCFDVAMLVKGNYGGYMNRTMKIWDIAAVHPLIEAAGGFVTDFYGNPVIYKDPMTRKDQNFTICAGAPDLYKKLQEIVHQPNLTQ